MPEQGASWYIYANASSEAHGITNAAHKHLKEMTKYFLEMERHTLSEHSVLPLRNRAELLLAVSDGMWEEQMMLKAGMVDLSLQTDAMISCYVTACKHSTIFFCNGVMFSCISWFFPGCRREQDVATSKQLRVATFMQQRVLCTNLTEEPAYVRSFFRRGHTYLTLAHICHGGLNPL